MELGRRGRSGARPQTVARSVVLKTVVLGAYPLSSDYRERLERTFGTGITYLNLAQLRAQGLIAGLQMVRSHVGEQWLLALEDETTTALLPFLMGCAVLGTPRSLEVVRGDMSRLPVSRGAALRAEFALAGASLRSWSAVRRARRELRSLIVADRLTVTRAATKRALFVYANLWFGLKAGGSISHVAGVVNGLSDAGFDVDFASSIEPVLIKPKVRTIPLRSPRVLGLPVEANYYQFQIDVIDQLRKKQFDTPYEFIYCRMSAGNYVGVPLSRALHAPLVAEYNGSEVWVARNWGRPLRYEQLARQAEDVTLRHAHVVVVVSEVLREEVLSRGVQAERVAFHPNGVDVETFSPERFDQASRALIRDRFGIQTDAVIVTFVGTFGRWHGVDVLARAIRRLVDTDRGWLERRKVRFMLVGDGQKMPEVRSILGDATDRFAILTGLVAQADTPSYLATSDVLVSPHVPNEDGSPFFGSPTKLFEYMAMSRGILASDLGQIGDVLQPALHVGCLPAGDPAADEASVAVLSRPGDLGELVEGIRFLVDRPRWRETLGARARVRALTRYSWRQHVETILDRIRSATGGPEP